ncbi:MAG TPA: Gfo/Idh/MocA family oxidoreductase [Candidatus Eisenbacteria bacterium]|nr:Gfo/Idh/MocA family oxidoreductase [Candidatus Eisenbacteria bacterium]
MSAARTQGMGAPPSGAGRFGTWPRGAPASSELDGSRGPAPRALPRLGFLGVGWIGQNRLEAVARSGKAEIACVVDSSLGRARDARCSCRDAAYSDDPALLFEADLDGVVIATPSALHAEQCLAFLSRGMAVFCQKPLGRNAAETAAVVREARLRDRLLGTDLCYRHVRGMREMRDLVRSGALGRPVLVDAVFHNAYGPDKPWFYDPARAGGGCLMDLGIHLLDLSAWLLDFPDPRRVTSRLHAKGERLHGRRDRVEDQALVEIDLASGAVIRIACSWNLPAGQDAVIGLSVFGTEGGAAWTNRNGSFYDFTVERFRGTSRETLAEPSRDWQGAAVTNWATRLARSPRFDEEAERLTNVAELLDLAYEADGDAAGLEPRGTTSRT